MEPNRGGRPRHPDVLTPAEWRVLDALREGGTNAAIAARLGLSADTVKTHISNMLAKLELRDRRALAAWRPDTPRRRVGGVLAVPAFVWSVGRPLAWVGAGAAALAGVVVVVVALVALEGILEGDGDFKIPSTVVETDLELMDCSSGIAVTNPDTNTELVGDCESLLGLRDTIRGTAQLNWTAGKAMPEWMGVTVSGTPQRVTALNLADLGLDGELSGLLGNLTGLTTLDLSGNPLTGMLPSKLALLENLTTASLSGTSFEGCAPEELGDVATSDVTLDDCGELPEVDNTPDTLDRVLGPGTYRVPGPDHSSLIFDIPVGTQLVFFGIWFGARDPSLGPVGGPIGVILRSPDNTAAIGLDVMLAKEWSRRTNSTESREAFSEVFDRIIESLWLETSE